MCVCLSHNAHDGWEVLIYLNAYHERLKCYFACCGGGLKRLTMRKKKEKVDAETHQQRVHLNPEKGVYQLQMYDISFTIFANYLLLLAGQQTVFWTQSDNVLLN